MKRTVDLNKPRSYRGREVIVLEEDEGVCNIQYVVQGGTGEIEYGVLLSQLKPLDKKKPR